MRIKGIFTVVILLFTIFHSYSQDTIVKTNGDEIAAKVVKVTPELVEYYKFNRTDGPLYSIYIADIDMIKYPDGSQDIFKSIAKDNGDIINEEIEDNKFIDERDGHEYKTVKIGEQWWIAENLQYVSKRSTCYDNDTANCEKCGRYYNFAEALTACPKGWHLPSDDEWMQLEIAVGMTSIEAKKSGWRGSEDGQASELVSGSDSGLELELCGKYSHATNDFIGLNSNGYYWSSTTNTTNSSWTRHFKLRRSIKRATTPQNRLLPARCIKDSE